MEFLAFSVTELNMSPEVFWRLSPQEWWPIWSMKFGKRHMRRSKGLPTDEEIAMMREDLDAAVAEERAK